MSEVKNNYTIRKTLLEFGGQDRIRGGGLYAHSFPYQSENNNMYPHQESSIFFTPSIKKYTSLVCIIATTFLAYHPVCFSKLRPRKTSTYAHKNVNLGLEKRTTPHKNVPTYAHKNVSVNQYIITTSVNLCPQKRIILCLEKRTAPINTLLNTLETNTAARELNLLSKEGKND